MDCSLAKKYGWGAKTSLDRGLDITIKDFQNKIKSYWLYAMSKKINYLLSKSGLLK